MARKKQSYIKGPFTHRRTESDYMGVLLDAVTLEDWRSVVTATVAEARAGDASARAWLAQYLPSRLRITSLHSLAPGYTDDQFETYTQTFRCYLAWHRPEI